MYGSESWTINKAERWGTNAFELCWRRFLRVTWEQGDQASWILKEINPEYSLEELMLKLKLQYFGHQWVKSRLIGKDSDVGREWGQEEKGTTEDGQQRMASLTRWTWDWVNSGSWWWTGRPGVLRFMGLQRVGHDWATELNILVKLVCSRNILSSPFLCRKD